MGADLGILDKGIGLVANSTLVTFDDVPAPLLYAYTVQINAIVPYEVAGQAVTHLMITHYGVKSETVELPVTDTSPAIFSVNFSGNGQGAILNQDRRPNSTANPAATGSVILIFGTGEGLVNPGVATGTVIHALPFPVPIAPVSLTIGGIPAQITYAGEAPSQIAGMLQVNAVVPAEVASGPQPVVLSIGDNSNSQQQITVAVQ